MRCLMRHLGTPIMTGPCESALLEIQYFVARDWKLDPQLYSSCYNDSVSKCHAKQSWAVQGQDTDPERGVLVLPCLFRYIYHPSPEHRVSEACSDEVRRVMHERSAYVDLHPDIEAACMMHLASMCSDRTKPGEELVCLQEHLEELLPECRAVVSNYTEAEAQDVQLNSLISIHCATLIPQVRGALNMDGCFKYADDTLVSFSTDYCEARELLTDIFMRIIIYIFKWLSGVWRGVTPAVGRWCCHGLSYSTQELSDHEGERQVPGGRGKLPNTHPQRYCIHSKI